LGDDFAGSRLLLAQSRYLIVSDSASSVTVLECVLKKRHSFGLLQLWLTSTDFDSIWEKCCKESKQSNGSLLSHLTYYKLYQHLKSVTHFSCWVDTGCVLCQTVVRRRSLVVRQRNTTSWLNIAMVGRSF